MLRKAYLELLILMFSKRILKPSQRYLYKTAEKEKKR